jgi:type I restriction enzyme S subunit
MNFGVNQVPLGELGEIVSGSTPDTSVQEYWGGNIPWITPAGLTDHTGIYFRGQLRKITRAGYDSCSTKLLPMGAIIYSSRAPIGHCAVTTFPLCTNQGFKSIIPNEKLNSVYGFFALRFFTPQIVAQGRGATFAEINKEIFENFRIPLPPIPEQKRITATLEKADRLRRQRHYALEISNNYLQSVFLEMFGDPATNPNQWQIGKLFQQCDKIVDCPHATPIYTSNQTAYACIRSSDIQNGFLDWSTTKYIARSEYEKRIRALVPMPKDVVYCREGARFGNAAIIPAGKQVCLGQRTMLFRADPNVATPEFIWAFLESESTRKQAIRLAGGSASPHLNVGDIKEFVTIIPPLPLQQKFAQIVQKFERLRIQQREAERQTEHLFQTLLHQAFEGNVGLGSVGVPDEDVVQPSVVDSQLTGHFVQLRMNY